MGLKDVFRKVFRKDEPRPAKGAQSSKNVPDSSMTSAPPVVPKNVIHNLQKQLAATKISQPEPITGLPDIMKLGGKAEPKSEPIYKKSNDGFKYRPLEESKREIRLIKPAIGNYEIDTFNLSGKMGVELHHFSLDCAPQYLALSYAWGSNSKTYSIICNGSPVLITENLGKALSTALCCIRDKGDSTWNTDEELFLWADGLCINQDDDEEKSFQVQLMTSIYQKARGTVGYTGAPQKTNPLDGVLAMMAIGHAAVSDGDGKAIELDEVKIEAYRELWAQTWYNRSWVNQEVVVSRHVECLWGLGAKNASWRLETMAQLVERAQSKQFHQTTKMGLLSTQEGGGSHPSCVEVWAKLRRLWTEGGGALDIVPALEMTRNAKCQDPRDKLYSIWGLLSKEDQKGIQVNYSKQNSVEKVYIDLATYCMGTDSAIQLLECAGFKSNFPGLPSWVPDWTYPQGASMQRHLYKCAGDKSPMITLSPDKKKITAKGVFLDNIGIRGIPADFAALLGANGPEMAIIGADEIARQISNHLKPRHPTYPNGEQWDDIIWRVLTADRAWGDVRNEKDDKRYYEAFQRRWPGGVNIDPVTNNWQVIVEPINFAAVRPPLENSLAFVIMAYLVQRRRVICSTTQGYLGVFPDDAKVGDLIAMLYGGNMPFLLRRKGRDFEILGPCYLHGVMDGEFAAVGAPRDFVIC
jgi:hypothetical protein